MGLLCDRHSSRPVAPKVEVLKESKQWFQFTNKPYQGMCSDHDLCPRLDSGLALIFITSHVFQCKDQRSVSVYSSISVKTGLGSDVFSKSVNDIKILGVCQGSQIDEMKIQTWCGLTQTCLHSSASVLEKALATPILIFKKALVCVYSS